MNKTEYRKLTYRGATFIVGSDGSVDGIKYFAPNSRGYMQTSRIVDGKTISFRIHRLVALAFLEKPLFKEQNIVDHIDGNKLNNAAENLRWCTYEENARNASEKNSRKVIAVNVNTGETRVYNGFRNACSDLHCSPATLFDHDADGEPLNGEWMINVKRKRP